MCGVGCGGGVGTSKMRMEASTTNICCDGLEQRCMYSCCVMIHVSHDTRALHCVVDLPLYVVAWPAWPQCMVDVGCVSACSSYLCSISVPQLTMCIFVMAVPLLCVFHGVCYAKLFLLNCFNNWCMLVLWVGAVRNGSSQLRTNLVYNTVHQLLALFLRVVP